MENKHYIWKIPTISIITKNPTHFITCLKFDFFACQVGKIRNHPLLKLVLITNMVNANDVWGGEYA